MRRNPDASFQSGIQYLVVAPHHVVYSDGEKAGNVGDEPHNEYELDELPLLPQGDGDGCRVEDRRKRNHDLCGVDKLRA